MNEKYLPLLATIAVFSALFITGGLLYNNFFSTLVLGDILADNAFVIIAAIGTTFVILSGGIDLSIGSMIGFVGVVMANLDAVGWHPLASGGMMLRFGLLFGALQGLIIDFCEIQPFIVTLAGLFLLRGGCFMINLDSVPIRHPFVAWFAGLSIPLPGDGVLGSSAIVMLVALAAAIVIAHFTRFGADVYAIGGDRASAALMGVPMRRTTVEIYALGGFYSALGGRDLRALYVVRLSAGRHRQRTHRDRVGGARRHGADGRRRHGRGHFVRRDDPRLDRDADQFQRFAERGLDHDQRRGSPLHFHRHAAIPAFIVQVAGRRLSFARGPCRGFPKI